MTTSSRPLYRTIRGLRVPLTARGLLPAYHCQCCGFQACAVYYPARAARTSERLGRVGSEAPVLA